MEENTKKYLIALSEKYPTPLHVKIRIAELNAALDLPKGTEHFMSDLHGEAEAFLHIRKSASGVIKNKINRLFSEEMTEEERAELATLIYYPEEKLQLSEGEKPREWYADTIRRIIALLRFVGVKYTISDFANRIVGRVHGFESTIHQLVWGNISGSDQYNKAAIKSAIQTKAEKQLISALSEAVKCLVVDRFHVVGDIFDRGERPDLIIEELMKERSVDIEWGNHDVLWMGAAAGSAACVAAVLSTSVSYGNLDVLELGYGISLRPLATFATETYGGSDCSAFLPRGNGTKSFGPRDSELISYMNKAISIIRFKLEGDVIFRNPHFLMKDRLLLKNISKNGKEISINGKNYPLKDTHFPTINFSHPYELTKKEKELISYYQTAFFSSGKLRRHIEYLYRVGSIYKIYNGNLLFHGCVPLNPDGTFMELAAADGTFGKGLMDFADRACREGYFAEKKAAKKRGCDFMWYLGCGRNSPLVGREKMATFERLLLSDENIKKEPKNAYYRAWEDEKIVKMILAEFGLEHDGAHIINGHIPRKIGENPIKAGGRLIVIDGGFCSAYHKSAGIAGYTLIYNAEGMRLSAHEPFRGREDAVKNNGDILSETVIFEKKSTVIKVRETDLGKEIRDEICDLVLLLREYESGRIAEKSFSDTRQKVPLI